MRHRQQYSSLGTAIGLAAIAATLAVLGCAAIALFRGAGWLIRTICGF